VRGQRLTPVKAVLGLAAAVALVALPACGGNPPDSAQGKQLFVQNCGSCHTLGAANTKGVLGPNLDDAFKQSIANGLGRDTVAGVVRDQIKVPQGPQMPAKLVTGDDATAVADYVADAVGKPVAKPAGGAGAAGASQGGAAKANAKDQLEIPMDPTGQLQFKYSSASAKAGNVTILAKNDSSVPHNIAVKGGGVNQEGAVISGGKTSKVTVDLKPGQYEFYCSVPGHEQAGMKGTLTVK
jgi:uncharacterized cupredoxin-like copper-binding protein